MMLPSTATETVSEVVLSNGVFASVRKLRTYEFLAFKLAISKAGSLDEVELLCVTHLVYFDDVKYSPSQVLYLEISDFRKCSKIAEDYIHITLNLFLKGK
jgi:hypothetical protein